MIASTTVLVYSAVSFLIAILVGMVTGPILNQYTPIAMFGASFGFAHYLVGTTTPALWIVGVAPIWVLMILFLVAGTLTGILGKRGYLGNKRKWEINHTFSNEARAAKMLLEPDEIDEIGNISADAEDYEENLIKAAGIDQREKSLDNI